ncbi:MAG: nicotinate phosphoribosyltransferase [Acidobacteria bacterium]|jgi:nicotinamide phosphoribosyltransferase|nr:MAG: nicotinate phosphoribosyltransferase [Acidobacteriota bacterium]GIU82149.1 MAG: nicotinate phosphoribosyltransferase [Pyrinomonadaceae bacterium]
MRSFIINPIVDTDSYKASHWIQYPPNTTRTFFYLESRGTERNWNETVFFGLQYILKRYFLEEITQEMVDEAREVITTHGLPFNYEGWCRLIEKHHGKLPLRIRAVPEGSVIPLRNALMTVETTDDEFFWLAGWFETQLMRIWYPITVATQSYYIKKDIYRFLQETADDPDAEIAFKLHDFGSRGVSSQETAAIGGAAHLVNFQGTDTMAALLLHREFYHAPMAGFSIPAAEHSTMTAWGRECEAEAYRNMLRQFAKPGSLVAVVSDSWDIFNAVEKIWGEELRQEVINSGATVVIRPDSGNPVEVVAKVASILSEKFGYTINSKGYKVLKYVRIIQGDGVNEQSIHDILERLKLEGFSASNIAFGMGGALLQKINRDTLKFAYKCSAVVVNGKLREVHKQPVTDSTKYSKSGRLDLIKNEKNEYETVKLDFDSIQAANSVMRTVFENGELLVDESLDEIRTRARI